MKQSYLLGGIIIVGLVIAGFATVNFMTRPAKAPGPSDGSPQAISARIEIVKGTAKLVIDGKEERELKNNETLISPATVRVAGDGRALVHFADGSVARVEGGTEFTLKEGVYDPTTKTLTARFFLSVGRIWSKIVELSSPASAWEVETSQAVATVRGTSFGTIAEAKRSRFLGSERSVAVVPIDPKTRERAAARSVQITDDKYVEVGDDILPAVIGGERSLKVTDIPKTLLADPWVTDNKKLDVQSAAPGDPTAAPSVVPIRTNPSPASGTVSTTASVVGLEIIVRTPFTRVIEGDRITFAAIAKFSDGRTADVTKAARWQVLGQIGRMEGPGAFLAGLDPAVAEFGEASGAVVATWLDPVTKKELLGKTPIFKVEANSAPVLNGQG